MGTIQTGKMGTAVVTGASSGIGKVYADRLAQRRYDLILVARRGDRLEALAKELRAQYGVSVQTIAADLGNAEGLNQVAQTLAADDSVTLLVNNAGTSTVGPLANAKAESLETLVNINIVALSRLTMAVLPGFLSRDRGAIVNIGSVVGLYGYPYTAIYGGTKAYVTNFTQSLQQQLIGTRVVAQLVAPAATVSEIWDVSGYPLSAIDPAIVMTTEDCVDASLHGLDMGEQTTMPSVHDAQLLANYDAASSALFTASQQTGKPASRYLGAH